MRSSVGSATRPTTQHGVVADWEAVNAGTPITELRWRLLHPGGGPGEPNPDALRRLRDLDAGVVPTDAGVNGTTPYPPYRRIYESGTHACLGSGAPDDAPALLAAELDLDAVARVRTHGTANVNRPWSQFHAGEPPIELPVYQGRIDPASWTPQAPNR